MPVATDARDTPPPLDGPPTAVPPHDGLLDVSDEEALWRSVYFLAGLCHPDCRGTVEQFTAVLDEARRALAVMGADPPPSSWAAPGPPTMTQLFDHAIARFAPPSSSSSAHVAPAVDGTLAFTALTAAGPEDVTMPDGWSFVA